MKFLKKLKIEIVRCAAYVWVIVLATQIINNPPF